jgi:hypothetical protein
MTGRCHTAHNSPSRILRASALLFGHILGNANPVQPISSKKPAGMPNPMPSRKLPGAKIGETKFFMQRRTIRIKPGGMRSEAYQLALKPSRRIRENRSLLPLDPSTICVKTNPEMLGPRSMMGNITGPPIARTDSPLASRGAATRRAPSHEIAKVNKKYAATGWRRTRVLLRLIGCSRGIVINTLPASEAKTDSGLVAGAGMRALKMTSRRTAQTVGGIPSPSRFTTEIRLTVPEPSMARLQPDCYCLSDGDSGKRRDTKVPRLPKNCAHGKCICYGVSSLVWEGFF